jgi:diguanylate cyclase (GGDEF)-like protein
MSTDLINRPGPTPDTAVRPATQPGAPAPDHASENKVLIDGSVMMIDDEPIMIEVVRTFLEESGYREFVGVSDPSTALARIHAERPDVLLLDLMMPRVSGFEILAKVRNDPHLRLMPVIVMTSASDAGTKLQVLELGATDFLEKPVDPSELTLRLRNTMAFKAYRDRMAYFDPLTNLPNRRLFLSQLASSVRRAKRTQAICALMHIDVDRFKQINESLGHRVGDTLLKSVSQRLQVCLRNTDSMQRVGDQPAGLSISRVGGDEFAALLPDMARIEDVEAIARRIIAVMARPFNIEGHELFVTASIGIAAFPHDGDEPETILKHADAALSHAKNRGRNTYSFYSNGLNARALERLTLENQLRRALERREFRLHYQPKVDVASGAIIGCEALIRWQHPEMGLIPPMKFIPIAEESNLIVEIGAWVLQEACRQCMSWTDQGAEPISVSVNAASSQFRDGRLLEDIKRALAATGLNPHRLTIELTESMLMGNSREALEALSALKALGVGLSLDDFGTGFSSLAYLKRMPLDELKVDRSFVTGIPADSDSGAIVSAVIALAHSMGLQVTAEGVETPEQLEFLKQRGCDEYQGYLCAKPMPSSDFLEFMLLRGTTVYSPEQD